MNTATETTPVTERPQSEQFVAPDVNIYEAKDGYVLEAEMPGVNKAGLELTVDGQEITITGRRAPESVTGETLLGERQRFDYRRGFELDPAIDTARITARMNQGVLYVNLPKSEQVKARKITVGD